MAHRWFLSSFVTIICVTVLLLFMLLHQSSYYVYNDVLQLHIKLWYMKDFGCISTKNKAIRSCGPNWLLIKSTCEPVDCSISRDSKLSFEVIYEVSQDA